MKGFIFDLDGTLADSIGLIVGSCRQVWQRFGLPVDEARIRSYIGVSLFDAGEDLLGPGRGQEYCDAYQNVYWAEQPQVHAYPGAVELLARLRAAGGKTAVCTAKRQRSAMDSLAQTGLAPQVDALIYSERTDQHKPHPAPALLAAADLGLAPADCLFIGDAIHDLRCGHNAGMPAVAVTWGAGERPDLLAEHPEYLADSMPQLTDLLLRLAADGGGNGKEKDAGER